MDLKRDRQQAADGVRKKHKTAARAAKDYNVVTRHDQQDWILSGLQTLRAPLVSCREQKTVYHPSILPIGVGRVGIMSLRLVKQNESSGWASVAI